MKKKIVILSLSIVALFLLGAAPVKAETTTVPTGTVHFSDEQIKLAQLNWNAYADAVKANPLNPAGAYIGPVKSVNPDTVIGHAAIINHFSPYYPVPTPQTLLNPETAAVTNNPYFEYYQYYYCTYQYR